jgi:hypothetical protein
MRIAQSLSKALSGRKLQEVTGTSGIQRPYFDGYALVQTRVAFSGKLSFPLWNLLIVMEADALEFKPVEDIKSVSLQQSRGATRLMWSRSEWLPEPR